MRAYVVPLPPFPRSLHHRYHLFGDGDGEVRLIASMIEGLQGPRPAALFREHIVFGDKPQRVDHDLVSIRLALMATRLA